MASLQVKLGHNLQQCKSLYSILCIFSGSKQHALYGKLQGPRVVASTCFLNLSNAKMDLSSFIIQANCQEVQTQGQTQCIHM